MASRTARHAAPFQFDPNVFAVPVTTVVLAAAGIVLALTRPDLGSGLRPQFVDASHTAEASKQPPAAKTITITGTGDIILGSAPEQLPPELIAYSLGNFGGYRVLSANGNRGIGATLAVTLTIDGDWVEGTMNATRMVDGGYPSVDPDNAAHELSNRLSREDFGGDAAEVTGGGRITPP